MEWKSTTLKAISCTKWKILQIKGHLEPTNIQIKKKLPHNIKEEKLANQIRRKLESFSY